MDKQYRTEDVVALDFSDAKYAFGDQDEQKVDVAEGVVVFLDYLPTTMAEEKINGEGRSVSEPRCRRSNTEGAEGQDDTLK